jgi:hypothetical protein
VVTETVKPKAELKSFWEKHQPADATPTRTPLRSNVDTSNIGRKWQVGQSLLVVRRYQLAIPQVSTP